MKQDSPAVSYIIDKVSEFYTDAYDSLCKLFAKSALNVPHMNFLVARRFCKCNFGALDHTKEDVDGGIFNFECVPCPLRGECPLEGKVCMPKMNTKLSEAEKRVMQLVCEGKSRQEIAEELCLSPNTVKSHIGNAYIKTKTHNRAEFSKYANDNSIF